MAVPSLSMPLFVNPEDVILRMQLSVLEGTPDLVAQGIIGAQLHLERVLGGKLSRRSHDCIYFLDSQAFSGIQPGGVYRVEVPSPFIRRDTEVVVTVSAAATALGDPGPFSTFAAVDSSLMQVDYARGYIYLSAGTYGDCYVRVRCDTGFNDGTNPSLPMEQIPEELSEAIISLVPYIFNSGQTTTRNAEAEAQYKTLSEHAVLLMQQWVRAKGFSFRPIMVAS